METVNGIRLSQFPYEKLEKVTDLIYYDGPILSHFKDLEGANYFFYWVDYNNNYNRWLVFRVHDTDLIEYLTGKENLLGLMFTNKNEFITLVDIDANIEYQNTMLVNVINLPEAYYPENDSYFTLPIPSEYEELIKSYKADKYLDILRQQAIYLKLSPRKSKYAHTVDALEAGKFINAVANSYISYVKAKFRKEFSDKYSAEKLKKLIIEISSQLKPRFVDLEFASFGVGLASDFINNPDTDKGIHEWKKRIINHYSDDVLEIDYTSEKSVAFVSEGFTPEERNSIYRPIINLIKSDDYLLSITDQNFKISKTVKKATAAVESKIIKKDEAALSSPPEKELISLVIEKEKGKPLSQINAKSLQAGLLYSEPISDFFIKMNNISQDENIIKLSKPLEVQVVFNNSMYEAAIPELSIDESSRSLEELSAKLHFSIYNSIYRILKIDSDLLSVEDILKLNFIQSYLQEQ